MSATETVQAVLQWAREGHHGPPPQGDLRAIDALCAPVAALGASLRACAQETAARLYVPYPFLGDPRPLHSDGLILASAIGVALVDAALAVKLLEGVTRPPAAKVDWLVRYTLISPALVYLSPRYSDNDGIFRDYSPLSGILQYPTEQGRPASVGIVQEVIQQQARYHAEYTMMILHLAQPTQDQRVRDWRTLLLKQLRPAYPEFVLDVYEAILVHHREEALAQIHQARHVLADPRPVENDVLQNAFSIADVWGPLYALNRSEIDRLRKRRYLGYDYLAGLELYGRRIRITGG